MDTTRFAILSLITACAATPVKPAAPVPVSNAGSDARRAAPTEEPAPGHDVDFVATFEITRSPRETKCVLRGQLSRAREDKQSYITQSATVDSADVDATRDCMQALFEEALHRYVTPDATPAPVAKVTVYDYTGATIATPGNGVVIGQVLVADERRNKGSILRALRGAEGEFANCAKQAVNATLTLELSIATTGRARADVPIGTTDPALDECVAGVARKLTFPISDGITTVMYPITFQSR